MTFASDVETTDMRLFDDGQRKLIEAICCPSMPHVIATGGAGSGKTTTVNFAIKKLMIETDVKVLRVAVSDLTAERFGGSDAVNLMLFFSIVDSFCAGRHHYAADENAAVAGFLRGLLDGRVIIAIDEFGLMSAADLTRTIKLLWRACGESLKRFAYVQLILIGDPAGQMPPIKGESVVFSSVFQSHPSQFAKRLYFANLKGQHRFSLTAREHMNHVLSCDDTGRDQYLAGQKTRYAKEANPHLYVTLLKSRRGCERVIKQNAGRIYSEEALNVFRIDSPASVKGTRKENESKYTPGSFIFPQNGDLIIIEITSWSNRIFAQSREDPDRKIKINNRQRFHITHGSFCDLPSPGNDGFIEMPERLSGPDQPSVSVTIDGEDYGIPIFVNNGEDGCVLGIRQVGFASPEESTGTYKEFGMALLLFNTQGDQFPGKKIIIGGDQDASSGTVLRLADFCVGVSRTSDPSLCLFHPAVKIVPSREELARTAAIKKALAELDGTNASRKRYRVECLAPSHSRQPRRSKFSSSSDASVSSGKKVTCDSGKQAPPPDDVFW